MGPQLAGFYADSESSASSSSPDLRKNIVFYDGLRKAVNESKKKYFAAKFLR